MLTLSWGSATDVGRVRELNEDSLCATGTVFAVADGMGGHAAGEVASELAIQEMVRVASVSPLHAEDITAAIWTANQRILDAGRERGRFGLGTTLAGLGLVSAAGVASCAVFNVGDSRVYRLSQGVLSQLTRDHSEVQELVDLGQLERAAARVHPRRNVVTRSLGSDPPPVADLWVFAPEAGDRFLICSDGLTGEIEDHEIAGVLAAVADPRQAAEDLVLRANAAGGHDNTSTVVIDLASDGTSSPATAR
jgi:serine/threonine protein phosphatase PrpC